MDNAIVLWTLSTLSTTTNMVLAVRLWVEYTAQYVDRWTGNRVPTFLYALATAYGVVYGTAAYNGTLGGGMVFVNVLNGLLVAVAAGILDVKPNGSALSKFVGTLKASPMQFTSTEEVTKAVQAAVAAAMESVTAAIAHATPAVDVKPADPTPVTEQPAPAADTLLPRYP